jgi:hypothetical protein
VAEKCQNTNLSRRSVTSLLRYAKQIKDSGTFADGTSLILDGLSTSLGAKNFNGVEGILKIAKDVIDIASNAARFASHIVITRCTLPERDRSFMSYFYKVEKKGNVEKKEIIFKRLVRTLASTCKVILWFVPQFQMWLKLPQYLSLFLNVAEIFLNRKNIFTENGKFFSRGNILKILLTLSYHVISCIALATIGSIVGIYWGSVLSSLFTAVSCVVGLGMLAEFFNWLTKRGMVDTIISLQQIDKLLFNNNIANSISEFIKTLFSRDILDENAFKCSSTNVRGLYIMLLGFNLCCSAVSAFRNSPGGSANPC